MSETVVQGYLVIGDISGYTSYVASTELEHSQAVLTELLELIITQFRPLLTFVKLEGDAVFAHAPERQLPRGESLLELLEATYVAFRDRVVGIVRHTTCECKACKAIPTLDLKFMVHFGDYFIQNVSGINDLVGSDVNLLHRLTKNRVVDETGWRAYALFTEACLQRAGVPLEGMTEIVENYEHLGDVNTYVLDLRRRYREIAEARRFFVQPEEAHGAFTLDLAVPAAVAWEWLSDPTKRNQAMGSNIWSVADRPRGRNGVGATNHCAHGKDYTCETVLDWRPFDYFTVKTEAQGYPQKLFDGTTTYYLEPIDGGRQTRLHFHLKLANPVAKVILRPLLPSFFKKLTQDWFEPMEASMMDYIEGNDAVATETAATPHLSPALDAD